MIHGETYGFLAHVPNKIWMDCTHHTRFGDSMSAVHFLAKKSCQLLEGYQKTSKDSPDLWTCFHTWPQQGHLINNRAMTLVAPWGFPASWNFTNKHRDIYIIIYI